MRYGDTDRQETSTEHRRRRLRDEVRAAAKPSGALLIPSFAVERTQELLVDLGVDFVKATGKSARKVFKVKRVVLAAGHKVELSKSISLAVHTTRKPQPGRHVVEVIVNGEVTRIGHFTVTG